jgi:hypothetical protein
MDIQDVIDLVNGTTAEYAERNNKLILASQNKNSRLSESQLQGRIGAVNAAHELRVALLNALAPTG